MREKILATFGIIAVFGLLAYTNSELKTTTQLISLAVVTPWIFVLYSRTIIANNEPLLPKEGILKFFGLTHLFLAFSVVIQLILFGPLINLLMILANQVYLILDLNNLIPFLRYETLKGFYSEVGSFKILISIVAFISIALINLLGLVCFAKNINKKTFLNSFLATMKYTLFNFKFWAIFISAGILMLFYPWLLIILGINSFHTLLFPVLITLLITPYLVKWLFPQILEEEVTEKKELKQEYKKLGLTILIIFVINGLLFFGNTFTFKFVENKLPPVVKEIRALNKINTHDAYKMYAESIVRKYPDEYKPYELLGDYYFENKDYKIAVRYYEKAINLAPNLVKIYSYINLYSSYEKTNEQRPDVLMLGLKHHPKSDINIYINSFYMDNKDLVSLYKNADNTTLTGLFPLQLLLNESNHFDKAVELENKIKKAENEERTGLYLKNIIHKEQIFLAYESILFAQISAPMDIAPSQMTKYAKMNNLIAQEKADEILKIIDKDKDPYHYAKAMILKNNFDEAQKYLDIQPNIKSQLKLLLKKKDYKEFFRYYKSLPPKKQQLSDYKKFYIIGLYETEQYKQAIALGEEITNKLWYDMDFFETMENCYTKVNDKTKAKEYEQKLNNLKNTFN